MSSTRSDQPSPKPSHELASLVSTLQLEMVGLKTRVIESEVRNESLQETIVNLAHENELLKRRIYGNKTERMLTCNLNSEGRFANCVSPWRAASLR